MTDTPDEPNEILAAAAEAKAQAEAAAHAIAAKARTWPLAKIGLGVSAVPIVIGTVLALAGAGSSFSSFGSESADTTQADALLISGYVFMAGGAVSMIAMGTLLGVRKRKLRRFQEVADLGHRRVQWDLARSRLVF